MRNTASDVDVELCANSGSPPAEFRRTTPGTVSFSYFVVQAYVYLWIAVLRSSSLVLVVRIERLCCTPDYALHGRCPDVVKELVQY